ncbi:hypothetical protein BDY19DRAFT_973421, partial [Irpex rosettiformis]
MRVPACCFTTCFQAHSIGSELCGSMGTGIDGGHNSIFSDRSVCLDVRSTEHESEVLL